MSSLLVFWLGSRYLSEALDQYSAAEQLQLSVAPEKTLFELANSLDIERAAIQRILVDADQPAEALDHLRSLSQNSSHFVKKANREVQNLLLHISEHKNNQQRHSNETIEFLIEDLKDKSQRMRISRSVIVRQINRPHAERDEYLRMKLFDVHVNYINSVNNLRKRIQSYPKNNYLDVLASQDIKDSIWVVVDSINQTSILIETFILKDQNLTMGSLNVDSLALRLNQQHERIEKAFSDLTAIIRAKTIAGISSESVTEVKKQYEKVVRPMVKQLILGSPTNERVAGQLFLWQSISKNIKESARVLEQTVIANTETAAKSIKSRTTASLIYTALLVLVCLFMAFATFMISRRVQYQSDHDDLTNIPNRRYFVGALESLFRKTGGALKEKIVLMTLDLNGFKSINDTMGHSVGDDLLKQVAQRLTATLREGMVLARMGGDEFAIAYSTTNSDQPMEYATEVRDAFNESFKVDDGQVNIDSSVGYSIFPDDAKNIKELQITSDFAMFRAKQSGRKTIQPFDRELAEKFETRLALEQDLLVAIETNSLELHYQPQVNLKLNQVDAVEALVRWNHPVRGLVPPNEFIGIAEDTGLMPAIGSWVLEEACRQAAVWKHNNANIRVAVNISVHQLMQAEFTQEVIAVIQKHHLTPDSIELEITESVVMTDINWIVSSLQALKDRGLRIALDDFGTGYSSLSQLQELPLDCLKIDRSFISGLDSDSSSMKSVTATIASIADIYGLETVAEGVETIEQVNEVKKLGIDVAQGYFYSKPLKSDTVLDSIAEINLSMSAHLNADKAA